MTARRELVCECGWRWPWDWSDAADRHAALHELNRSWAMFHVEIDGVPTDRKAGKR